MSKPHSSSEMVRIVERDDAVELLMGLLKPEDVARFIGPPSSKLAPAYGTQAAPIGLSPAVRQEVHAISQFPTPDDAREVHEFALRGARRAGAPADLCRDVAQSVTERFIEKWNKPHVSEARARGTRAWHNYIQMAATNAYADHRVKESRRAAREERSLQLETEPHWSDRPGRVALSQQETVSGIDESQARQHVVDLIDECLSGVAASVARLTFVEGCSVYEISEKLGLSVRAVSRHKLQGIRELRSLLSRT